MPDIAIIIRVFHTVENLLHRIELIRAKHHEAFVALMQYNVLANNLTQCTLVEEHCGKLLQVVERHISGIRPVECELIATIRVVGKIASVHTIRYDKQLDVIKQTMKRSFVITLYLVVCLFQFHTSALQFYLNQRQTIDKYRHIITTLLSTFNRNLIGNLKLVLTPMSAVQELHPQAFTAFHFKRKEVTQIFGFTGTPIFVQNAVDGHTTKEIFGNCLHKYLIKDAIADENVLGFLVEYYHGNEDVDNADQDRMTEIAKFILNNFNKSTFDGEFDALFAVQSVPVLIRYYKIFKSLNPKIRIGAVFTYAANNSQDDDLTGMNTGNFVSDSIGEADELQAIMDDYNNMYGTSFTTENFRAYYDDINLRMKKKKGDMKSLDLCLVVGMFLTGFDSKKLNTLYVDKNMEYHGLLQAFSRTNRVLNEKKRFGKVVCFRDLKSKVDESIKLFSNSNNLEDIVRPPFDDVKTHYQELTKDFLEHYPEPHFVDYLQSENDKKQFVLAFRDIIKKHAEIQVYDEFEEDAPDLGMTEQQFMDFRSKYLDIYDSFAVKNDDPKKGCQVPKEDSSMVGEPDPLEEAATGMGDIDFCLELLHSDIINVAYILELIADLNPYSEDYEERRKHIIDTMIKDVELRSKAKLIDGFIQKNVDDDRDNFMARKQKADGTSDLEERLNNYIVTERNNAVNTLAKDEDLDAFVLNHYLSEYDYLQKEQPEIIQEALKEKHLGLIKKRKALTRIMERLRNIIVTFNWE
jgi:type I restriction enzyme, R subunit